MAGEGEAVSGLHEHALRPLEERMAQALAGDDTSMDAAAEAGLKALGRALARADERSSAFDLLVADALITQACTRAASDGLPAALSAARFAALLEEQA